MYDRYSRYRLVRPLGRGVAAALGIAAVASVLAHAANPVAAPVVDGSLPLELTGVAINRDGVGGAETGRVSVTIERWSTDAEREKLVSVLDKSGPSALLDWLEDVEPRTGFIQVDNGLGWDIQYARYEKLPEGGTRIIFATDRPMSYWELTTQPRTVLYQFVFCDMRLDETGEGRGKLVGVARLEYNRTSDQIEIENYNIEPIRLTQIHVVGEDHERE